ncbi:ATP-binding protein [Methanocalculus sp. MC3]
MASEMKQPAQLRRRRIQGPLSGLRVIVTGKGGVGKTTFTALLAGELRRRGLSVLAIDSDPQEDLAYSLGFSSAEIVPVTKNRAYLEEKVGSGGIINLNPDLSDIVTRCGTRRADGIGLLVMGTVDSAGGGCLCPENTIIRSIARQVRVKDGEAILMDTPAGLEHFGRGLGRGFSHLIAVSEPTEQALRTACRTAELAGELGIQNRFLVINKIRNEDEFQRSREILGDTDLFAEVFRLPYDERLPGQKELTELTAGEDSPLTEAIAGIATLLMKKERE